MVMTRQFSALSLALLLAIGVSGCESFGRCTTQACAADAKITAEVYELLGAQTELGAPGQLRVQTINGVVYLTGLVNTELDSRIAAATALKAANVKDVVNSIGVRGNER
jgi:osmotically-inducible protein OsmY